MTGVWQKNLASIYTALLIAGNHHVNRAFGVPLHLFDLSQQETATVVIVTDSVADFTQRNADYLWIIQNNYVISNCIFYPLYFIFSNWFC